MGEKKKKAQLQNFEKSLSTLEGVVNDLESGELPLEECIGKFEEGVKLYQVCKALLSQAEKKIKVLSDSLKEEDL